MATVKIPTYQRQVYKQGKTIDPKQQGVYPKQMLDNPANEDMQKAGNVIGNVAKEIVDFQQRQQKQDDQILFMDYENSLNDYYNDVMYNDKDGLMYKKGQDSANLVEQLKEKAQKFEYKPEGNVVEIPERLRDKIQLSKNRIFTEKLKTVASYQVHEQQKYKEQLANANINNEISNNINNVFTKKTFDRIDSIVAETNSEFGKDVIDFKKKQARDEYTKQRISLLLDVSDNEQAKKDLETVKDKITPQTYEYLKKAVRGGLLSDYARTIFDEMLVDSIDDSGYVIESNIDKKIDDIKGEKFTLEEKEKMKNLVRSKANHLKYEINQTKSFRQNEFQNNIAKMMQEGGHTEEEFEKIAIGYATTPLEQQTNLKYVDDLFKKNVKSDPDTVVYLWDMFDKNTITRDEILQEYNKGNLSQATYISMLKRYDKDTLGSGSNDYARWKEINARITDFANKNKNEKYSATEIKNELIQSVMNLDYTEANKKLDEVTKTGLFKWTPIYRKNIENRRELERQQSVIDEDLRSAGIDKGKFIALLQKGQDNNISFDDVQGFIYSTVGLGNLRNPGNNSLELEVLKQLIEQNIPLTQDTFAKAIELAKEQQ